MSMPSDDQKTHFGFRDVPRTEKSTLVAHVFHQVAQKYDLMNDLMSFGLHRAWKRFTLNEAHLKPGDYVLDVASGTGDLVQALLPIVGDKGRVVMTDINESMLEVGLSRLANQGMINRVQYLLADAEKLPFNDNTFDCITIAFGLRNVTNKLAALQSMYRVLKPGGKVLILEFSSVEGPLLNKFYELYSMQVIPKIGALVAGDRDSYQYLVESIRRHPNQDALKALMEAAGFEDVIYHNLTQGIVALHIGYKY